MEAKFTTKDMKEAFKAGEKYGADVTMSFEDGLPIRKPDFDKWFHNYRTKNNGQRQKRISG